MRQRQRLCAYCRAYPPAIAIGLSTAGVSPNSSNTSRVCAPSDGVGPATLPGVCENHDGMPGKRTGPSAVRSEEHTSELQSLMRISYAVLCLKKNKINTIKLTKQTKKNKTEDIKN